VIGVASCPEPRFWTFVLVQETCNPSFDASSSRHLCAGRSWLGSSVRSTATTELLKKLQKLSHLNCGIQLCQIWTHLIIACAEYCKRMCTVHRWSGPNDDATDCNDDVIQLDPIVLFAVSVRPDIKWCVFGTPSFAVISYTRTPRPSVLLISTFSTQQDLPHQPSYLYFTPLPLFSPLTHVVVIALNFSTAYDTVPHHTLLCKLAQMNIPNNVYNWISHFLSRHSYH